MTPHEKALQKAESLYKEFANAINNCSDLRSDDYTKHVLNMHSKQTPPIHIKIESPKSVYLFLPRNKMAWNVNTLNKLGFKEDKTLNLKFDLEWEISVFSIENMPDNSTIDMPKVERPHSSVAVFSSIGKV